MTPPVERSPIGSRMHCPLLNMTIELCRVFQITSGNLACDPMRMWKCLVIQPDNFATIPTQNCTLRPPSQMPLTRAWHSSVQNSYLSRPFVILYIHSTTQYEYSFLLAIHLLSVTVGLCWRCTWCRRLDEQGAAVKEAAGKCNFGFFLAQMRS